jgi:hypothetical protein
MQSCFEVVEYENEIAQKGNSTATSEERKAGAKSA